MNREDFMFFNSWEGSTISDNSPPFILNLTPHALAIHLRDGEVLTIPSDGVARVATTREVVTEWNGLEVCETSFGDVEGLPSVVDGTVIVVSRLVLQARPDREDLLSPGELVRDTQGRVVGCNGLSR